MSTPLSKEWVEALTLTERRPPELYFPTTRSFTDGPHAGALRAAFDRLGLAAVFCIEDVPTIGFLVLEDGEEQSARIDEVHHALWNQGLMTLLLVLSGDVLRAYSLGRRPQVPQKGEGSDRRLVRTFDRVAHALELRHLVLGVESGRWWREHEDAFDPSERVDQVLLDNLMTAFRRLRDSGLPGEAAQAVLMQTMFIAYLEDRGAVLPAYFEEATGGKAFSLLQLLALESSQLYEALFDRLRRDFNGDIFLALCAFERRDDLPRLSQRHFIELQAFRAGREVMETGQGRFWAYDFAYIPVVLLSAVYDRFLSETPETKRKEGAYYTPMYLVDTVVSQVWEALDERQRSEALVIDPACGSGVFLVRLFQRIVEHARAKNRGKDLDWLHLVATAKRLHGMDVNPSALRVALFSLYIALLEQVTPPDIRALMQQGRMLPEFWGHTLLPTSFFKGTPISRYDIIVGNPPWTSRRGDTGGAQKWCEGNNLPCPLDEAAWGFIWKAGRILAPDGIVALLVPAMGVLHNHARDSVEARRKLLRENRVERIINFSDLTFQLFEGADRPAALVLFRSQSGEAAAYRFEYWCPKADLNLRLKRVLTLSHIDRVPLRSDFVCAEPQLLKRRLWMRRPDEKLLQHLTALPRLNTLVEEYRRVRRRRGGKVGWVIGQGFKPAMLDRLPDESYSTTDSLEVTKYPFLKTEAFCILTIPRIDAPAWPVSTVHRAGFTEGFVGPHILIPQGVERDVGRVRAAYTDQSLTFRHSIQAIKFPKAETNRAKLLTAILNSRLTAWFVFHETANLGTDRAKVHQAELLGIPFPSADDLPDHARAETIAQKIIDVVDEAIVSADDLFSTSEAYLEEVDRLVYMYFSLSDDEIAVVDDTLDYIIPAMQPRESDFPKLWQPSTRDERQLYAETLAAALGAWLDADSGIDMALAGLGKDLAALRLRLVDNGAERVDYYEPYTAETAIAEILNRIWQSLPQTLPGNFQIIPDLRIFLDKDLFMVKPRQLRYWLRSTALADADGIAADLHQVSAANRLKASYSVC